MFAMFVFASIPMKEKRQMKTRTDFAEYKKEVSMLIPLPPKG
jgi:steroid 5-alpha reductase family enzyme